MFRRNPSGYFLLIHLFLSINFHWFWKILHSIFWKSLSEKLLKSLNASQYFNVAGQGASSSRVPKIKKPVKLFLVVGSLPSLFIAVMTLLGIALFWQQFHAVPCEHKALLKGLSKTFLWVSFHHSSLKISFREHWNDFHKDKNIMASSRNQGGHNSSHLLFI